MEPQTNNNEPAETTETPAPVAPVAEEKKENGTPAGGTTDANIFSIIGYILPFLFFVPLLDEKTKNVPAIRFHANQQLILLIVGVAVYVLSGFLMGPLMMLGYYVMQILNFGLLVLAIVGAINAYKGEMKELPFVGQYKILK